MPFEKRMDKYRKYQFLPQHLEARPLPRALVPLTPENRYSTATLHCTACIVRSDNATARSTAAVTAAS